MKISEIITEDWKDGWAGNLARGASAGISGNLMFGPKGALIGALIGVALRPLGNWAAAAGESAKQKEVALKAKSIALKAKQKIEQGGILSDKEREAVGTILALKNAKNKAEYNIILRRKALGYSYAIPEEPAKNSTRKELELLPKDQYDEQVEEDATPNSIAQINKLTRKH